jgi:hypothetical protein
MSDNCRFYVLKMNERRAWLRSTAPLRQQLAELFSTVAQCEAMWALEDRIEMQR